MKVQIKELLTDIISGEWGDEPTGTNDTPIIRTANFTNSGDINLENIILRKVSQEQVEKKKLLKGDIIIEKSGGSPAQPVGRVVYFDIDSDAEYLCNNFTTVLRPNKQKVHPKFLFYQLFIAHQRGRSLKHQNKTTGIINLKLEGYLKETIDIPTLQTQTKIAIALTKAKTLIKSRKSNIDLLDDILKSTFLKTFGDPVKNEKNWKTTNLENVVEEFKYGTNTVSGEKNADQDFPILRIPNIIGEKINFSNLKYSKISEAEKHKITLKKGDILFVRTNGNPAYIARCAVYNDNLECGYASYLIRARLKLNSPVSPDLIKEILSFPSYRKILLSKGTTTAGNYNINIASLKSLEIYIPPKNKQLEFSVISEKVEALTNRLRLGLNNLEDLYKALSQKAFNGELKLDGLIIKEGDYFLSPKDALAEQIDHVDEDRSIAEPKKRISKFGASTKDQDLREIDEATAKKNGKMFYREWLQKNSVNRDWEKSNFTTIANLIKDRFWNKELNRSYFFNSEILYNYLQEIFGQTITYYTTKELFMKPNLQEEVTFKAFVDNALQGEKFPIKFEQFFYNADEENFNLELNELDLNLLNSQSQEMRSGIFFKIL